jgi:hypothetical protein
MTCSVSYNEHTGGIAVRDEVRAPNGEKSILYEHIKAAIPTNYQPDAYVLTAFKTGTINSLSIDDVAFALWSKLHTDWLEKDMKASGMPRDRNGEPLFAYVHERIGLPNVHKRYLLSGAKGASVVVKKLEANGWIERVGGKFRVLGSEFGVQRSELTVGEEGLEGMDMERWRMEMDEAEGSEEEAKTEAKDKERGAVEEHRFKINYLLDWLGIPEGFVQYEEQEGHTYVRFNPDLFQVNDRLNDTDASAYSNTRSLLGYLADRSPQLQFRFVSEEEGRTLYDALERPGKLPFEKANSFVDKGVVYLIRGRVNNLVAIEEVLHPFVHTIAETNKDLFAHLLDAARKDYEGLDEEIKSRYTDEAGFTNDERDRELVTQVLTQVYADEVEQYKAKSVRAVLPKLIDWLLQLVKELGDLLGGKDRFLIRPQDLSSRMNLTDVAELLNTYDSTFLIDARTMGASFSLATEKETFQRKLLKGANPLQEKMIKDLMEPQEPAVYDADQKAYVGTNGEEYQSLKTAIDGEETDADGRDGLRQVFGIHAAHVLEGLALGESFDAVKDVVEGVDVAVAEKAYHALAEQLESLVPDDSVVVPNVVVSDYDNDVASTLDLVVLDADGKLRVVSLKLSADSIFDKARYEQDRKPVGTLSQLTGESLSALQRHGIRVAGERRLLENNGYEVEQGVSVHVHVPDMGVGTGKKAYDVKVEDVQEHEAFDHRVLLNQVFPIAVDHKRSKQERFKKILGKGNPTRNRRFLRKEEQGPEEPLKEPVDAATVKQEVPKELKDLSAEIDKLMKAVQYHPKSPMVQKLSELVKFVQFDLTKGQGTLAYARFLNKAQEEIDKIMAFLADETKVGDSEYARVAIEAEMYLRSFEGIADAFHLKLGREFHSKKLTTLLRSLNALNSRIYMSLEQFILHLVRTTSTKELTKDDLEDLVAHAIDISKEKYLFNDIDSSPDTLTAVAARTYKRTRQTAMDRIEAFQKRVDKKIEETEKIAGPIDIKKFIELDDKGQPTGRYVQKIGPVYFRLLEALENKVRTVEGMLRQYRKVTSLASAKQEDLDYNKKLFADNQAIRKFKEAETQTATGVTDGMYHQYKQDYKTEREKFEEYQPQFKNGVFTGGKWVRKKTYNNVPISDYAYNQFRDKYYDIIIYDKPIFQNKVFTGAFVKNGGKMRVVKQEYINIREVAGDGTDMVSKQWNALNDDMSAKGRAVWGMYTFLWMRWRRR